MVGSRQQGEGHAPALKGQQQQGCQRQGAAAFYDSGSSAGKAHWADTQPMSWQPPQRCPNNAAMPRDTSGTSAEMAPSSGLAEGQADELAATQDNEREAVAASEQRAAAHVDELEMAECTALVPWRAAVAYSHATEAAGDDANNVATPADRCEAPMSPGEVKATDILCATDSWHVSAALCYASPVLSVCANGPGNDERAAMLR